MNNYEYGQYIVKKGDSLYQISKLFNTTPEELMMLNNLGTTMIYPNQILLVPYNSSQGFECGEYKTQNGDTINKICNKFNLSESDLMLYNNVYRLELVPNQILNLNNTADYYIVKETDELEDILSQTGLSCVDILKFNKNLWLPGTKIKLK